MAHDARKSELVDWVRFNAGSLESCTLYCTGTTGRLIREALKETLGEENMPEVNCLLSGPLGGDAQIGAMIAEGKVDMLVFFCDNLIMQGHQNDVMGLVRLHPSTMCLSQPTGAQRTSSFHPRSIKAPNTKG